MRVRAVCIIRWNCTSRAANLHEDQEILRRVSLLEKGPLCKFALGEPKNYRFKNFMQK